jgi:hypothetical protein
MAIAVLMEFPGATVEQYDAVVAETNPGGKPGPGGIFHVAGPSEGGGIRIVDVWESREAMEKFAGEQIMPILQEHGVAAPKMTVWPVHGMLK